MEMARRGEERGMEREKGKERDGAGRIIQKGRKEIQNGESGRRNRREVSEKEEEMWEGERRKERKERKGEAGLEGETRERERN